MSTTMAAALTNATANATQDKMTSHVGGNRTS
jgi:hypothetical protein